MRSTWPSIRKEVRALGPVWLATVIAILVFQPRAAILHGFGAAAYFLGAAALGALSIGHEYTNRTLPFLLTVPARRGRLLLIKLGVLAVMLLTLCGVAGLTVFHSFEAWFALTALCLPVMYGLFVAPWLTMICRSPIAGTVFNVGIAGILLIVGERLGTARYGYTRDVDIVRMAVLWYGSIAVCVVGAVMSWRTFMSLEAIDDRGPELSWPTWLRQRPRTTAAAPAFTKQYPIWLLVKKELRLQQMSLAVPGLYLVGSFAVIPYTRPDPDIAFALTIFCGGLIAVLIGSLASAEERALGTLPAQVLLPVSMRTQWAVKLTVVLALALVLAFGLPVLVLQVFSKWHSVPLPLAAQLFRPSNAVPIVLLTLGSLYVSSLCTGGLWALIVSLPAMFGTTLFVQVVAMRAMWLTFGALSPAWNGKSRHVIYYSAPDGFVIFVVAGVCALLLGFAFVNHRSAEPARGRAWKQVLWLAAAVTGGFVSSGAVAALINR
jgi:hypothetical protein